MRLSRTISNYLVGAVLPYLIFSWLLLSVILFVQQAGRFSDIFFSVNIPSSLIWQLTLALVPNVIAFTCPMAALVGVVIGLTKMQGDSELTAIRAAGVGNVQIALPFAAIGLLLSGFAFLINIYGVPLAARVVRTVAMQTAIYKLESPIEPGVFNTEIAGLTIYVKEGDLSDGSWKKIFIYNEDEKAGIVRLITSDKGRIDYSDQLSELVLDDAVVSTISSADGENKFISERVGKIRYAVKTRRGELVEKLSGSEFSPEELGLAQLAEYADKKVGLERTEAQILWQRRIILSITPLVFCLLGTSMAIRFHRRGRGFGIFLALLVLIVYYLLAFLGEQLARTGKMSVLAAGAVPITASAIAFFWFTYAGRIDFPKRWVPALRRKFPAIKFTAPRVTGRNIFVDLTTGLRDFDLIVNILKFYLLTLGFLGSVFVIFTAFELWKFAGTMEGGIPLLLKYLVFLLPFIYIQLSPSAAMIATLATYVIKSRQNEIVTWTSAGQSVYRLLLPCFVFMMGLGIANWQLQERLLPDTNRTQDALRAQIRSRGTVQPKQLRNWVAQDNRIYGFELGNASDNDESFAQIPESASNVLIMEFRDNGELQTLYRIPSAKWKAGRIIPIGAGTKSVVGAGLVETSDLQAETLNAETDPFAEIRSKPSHLDISSTKSLIASSESELEKRSFEVALEKKYSTLVLPLVIALFTAPFSLSLSRKGKVVTVGFAVALWLLFMGVTSAFEQLGLSGRISPAGSIWGPLALFSMLGAYLLSRVRT